MLLAVVAAVAAEVGAEMAAAGPSALNTVLLLQMNSN